MTTTFELAKRKKIRRNCIIKCERSLCRSAQLIKKSLQQHHHRNKTPIKLGMGVLAEVSWSARAWLCDNVECKLHLLWNENERETPKTKRHVSLSCLTMCVISVQRREKQKSFQKKKKTKPTGYAVIGKCRYISGIAVYHRVYYIITKYFHFRRDTNVSEWYIVRTS